MRGPSKVYHGVWGEGQGGGYREVHVDLPDGASYELPPATHVHEACPGFSWGYSGCGPAQLAVALLYDLLRDGQDPHVEDTVREMYRDLHAEVTSALPHGQDFQIDAKDLTLWYLHTLVEKARGPLAEHGLQVFLI